MKRQRQGFRFLGFVALADTLFAVSAGLLLINPIRFDTGSQHGSEYTVDAGDVRVVLENLEAVEKVLDELEQSEEILVEQAAEVTKAE